MWDLPGPGLEPVSPALAGGFVTTVPPGKPNTRVLFIRKSEADIQAWRGHLNIFSANADLNSWWWWVVMGGGARETTLPPRDGGIASFTSMRTGFFLKEKESESNIGCSYYKGFHGLLGLGESSCSCVDY